jgi:hypothetical protein
MLLKEIGYEGVDRINLANDKNQQRNLVNMVRNLQVTCKVVNFIGERLLASQEILHSVELRTQIFKKTTSKCSLMERGRWHFLSPSSHVIIRHHPAISQIPLNFSRWYRVLNFESLFEILTAVPNSGLDKRTKRKFNANNSDFLYLRNSCLELLGD